MSCDSPERKGSSIMNNIDLIRPAGGPIERVMNDLKVAASRRLNKAYPEENGRTRWTRHGSTRHLWREDAFDEKVRYVLDGQGDVIERFPK
jgi:hypothetical protein